MTKRALVLGCGGVAGAAWSTATLNAVQQRLNWDPREADIIVGTSSGAVLATLLASGVSVEQLMACQRGEQQAGCQWNHDHDSGAALPPMPSFSFTASSLIRRARTGHVGTLAAIGGALPRGNLDMKPFRRLIDSVVEPGQWVDHPATWIMAVESSSGDRVSFGSPTSPKVPMSDAVCASYAVPGC